MISTIVTYWYQVTSGGWVKQAPAGTCINQVLISITSYRLIKANQQKHDKNLGAKSPVSKVSSMRVGPPSFCAPWANLKSGWELRMMLKDENEGKRVAASQVQPFKASQAATNWMILQLLFFWSLLHLDCLSFTNNVPHAVNSKPEQYHTTEILTRATNMMSIVFRSI